MRRVRLKHAERPARLDLRCPTSQLLQSPASNQRSAFKLLCRVPPNEPFAAADKTTLPHLLQRHQPRGLDGQNNFHTNPKLYIRIIAPVTAMLSSLGNPRQAAAQFMNFGLILSTAFIVRLRQPPAPLRIRQMPGAKHCSQLLTNSVCRCGKASPLSPTRRHRSSSSSRAAWNRLSSAATSSSYGTETFTRKQASARSWCTT